VNQAITPMAAARKAKELRDYFDSNGRIHLVVDATRDDVQVPANLKGDPTLCLLLSVRMPQIIEITKNGVKSTFSFSGNPFACVIPIDAIWAAYPPKMSLDQGVIWQDDIPPAVQQVMQSMMPKSDLKEEEGRATSEEEKEETAAAPAPPTVAQGRRKGHLRIV